MSLDTMTTDDRTLIDWIIEEGLKGLSRQTLLKEYCQRLCQCGIPLHRMHLTQSAMHPVYGGIGFTWRRAGVMDDEVYPLVDTPRERWLKSPFYHILSNGFEHVRLRIDDPACHEQFPLMAQLADEGGTDYYARAQLMQPPGPTHPYYEGRPPAGLIVSWTSNDVNGFSDRHINSMTTTLPYLSLALKTAANRRTAEELLSVYLGKGPGARVMSGELERGSLERIDAAILLFDISGFTTITEEIPAQDVIDLLNDTFGTVEPIITKHGGLVLKFMGDGLLAMFDVGSEDADAQAALAATHEIQDALERLAQSRSAAGQVAAGHSIALHVGKIDYGNIGARDRLDFTVIGSAVNMTARLAGMHRAIGQSIILSKAFRDAAGPQQKDLVALGRYMLRGIPAPQDLFTIYRDTDEPAN